MDARRNYRAFLNRMGLKMRAKTPDIPDHKLMVGSAEEHESQPAMVYRDYKTPTYKILSDPLASISAPDGEASSLVGTVYEPDDFVRNTYYLGEPTGAI